MNTSQRTQYLVDGYPGATAQCNVAPTNRMLGWNLHCGNIEVPEEITRNVERDNYLKTLSPLN